MPDTRRASDVPDDFRRAFIEQYHAEHGEWPGAMVVREAYLESHDVGKGHGTREG